MATIELGGKDTSKPVVAQNAPKLTAPDAQLCGVPLKQVLSKKELRQRVRFVFRECSDGEWGGLRGSLVELAPQAKIISETADGVVDAIGSVFRRGEAGSPRLNFNIQRLVDRVIKTPQVMEQVNQVYDRLSKIPPVSTADALDVLEKVPPAERERILAYVPATKMGGRNADMLRDRASGMGYDEIGSKYNKTPLSAKTFIHNLLSALVSRPLARQAILDVQPDVSRSTIRETLKVIPDGMWDTIEQLIPLNPFKERQDSDRTIARFYFRYDVPVDDVALFMGITTDSVKTKLGLILNGLRANPQAESLILEYLKNPGGDYTGKAGTSAGVGIAGVKPARVLDSKLFMAGDSLETPIDFDLTMLSYRGKFLRTADMMKAGGLWYSEMLRRALRQMPAGGEAGGEKEEFYAKVKEMAGVIPVFASFLGTQPDFILRRAARHFDKTIHRFEKKTPSVKDIPRLALYRVLSNQTAVTQGLYSRQDDTGKEYQNVGNKYRSYAVRIKKMSGETAGLYSEAEGLFGLVAKAIDPAVEKKMQNL